MVLERANCALGSVATMNMWRNELEVNVLVLEVIFEHCGGFVVERVELGFEAATVEESECTLVGCEHCFFEAVLHWLGVDEIAIKVIED